ncbi:MAG: V4R domain-containing protein [Candidatus Micrarchaeaceae archaeon]
MLKRKSNKNNKRKIIKKLNKVKEKEEKQKANTKNKKVFQKIQEHYIDLDDLLLSKTLSSNKSDLSSGTLSSLIFNMTHSLQQLSYNRGYTTGKLIFQKYSKIDDLFKFMEVGGLCNIYYYPFGNEEIIKSKSNTEKENYGIRLHNFEAGAIAGYFSGFFDKSVYISEESCVFEGSQECTFKVSFKTTEKQNNILKDAHMVLKEAILSNKEPIQNNSYQILSLLPLMSSEKVLEELSKLFYVSGLELSKCSTSLKLNVGIEKIANFIGAEIIKSEVKEKAKKYIFIKYNNYNSIRSYVLLTSNIFLGFTNGTLKKEAKGNITINKDNSYILKLNI